MIHRAYTGHELVPQPVAFSSTVISTTVVAITTMFTEEQLDACNCAILSAHAGEVHYRYDGGAPTSTTGLMLVNDAAGGDVVIYGEDNVRNLQFVKEAGGADASLSIQLEKRES